MKMVVEPLKCRVLLSWLSDLPFVSASSSGKQGQQPPPTGAVGGVKVTHASTRASQGIWLVPFHGPPLMAWGLATCRPLVLSRAL